MNTESHGKYGCHVFSPDPLLANIQQVRSQAPIQVVGSVIEQTFSLREVY
jgi:hypothetical protein